MSYAITYSRACVGIEAPFKISASYGPLGL